MKDARSRRFSAVNGAKAPTTNLHAGLKPLLSTPMKYAYSHVAGIVTILAKTNLWGHAQAEVYAPALGRVLRLPLDDLLPLADAPPPSLAHVLLWVAAARIRAALAEGALLAPLTARVIPLPHQLAALRRALAMGQPRLLLADEVGLGKTIEAGLIMRELKLRGMVRRTLVVAPTGLTAQWCAELRSHFAEPFHVLSPADFPVLRRQDGDANIWRRFTQVICPLDAVKPLDARRGWSREQVARYNAERLDDLVAAGWDLVIFDEAHRLAGSSEQVARYQLARALAEVTPFLLLLSATPHSGKTDAFRRLLSLLDPQAFAAAVEMSRERVAPFVVRTSKREAVDAAGAPLFRPRQTRILSVAWGSQHTLQRSLYDAVSEYVRAGYNAARRDRRLAIGFLLVLMQRLVSSSTRAIREALERRLAVLQAAGRTLLQQDMAHLAELWDELDGEGRIEHVLDQVHALRGERQEVEQLLSLARRCEAAGPDARADALVAQIFQLQQERNNPQLKFLVFTEFTATQAMLYDLLVARGFVVAMLNGAMAPPEREAAQHAFAHEAQILISTDAGGEGLNLQFCSIVINYDLPWNPMRIEQRIGRVDRIGQSHPVHAINLVLADSVEGRVQEVLQAKLITILEEFGIDKSADVLDSAASEAAFERLFLETLLDPTDVEQQVDRYLGDLHQQAKSLHEAQTIYTSSDETARQASYDLASAIEAHPIPYWLERLTLAAIEAEGGSVLPRLGGYDLRWRDGTLWEQVTFDRRQADATGLRLLSLEEPRLRMLLQQRGYWVAGAPLPCLRVGGIPAGIAGVWALFAVSVCGAEGELATAYIPLFLHEDGRLLDPTARWLWDHLLRSSTTIQAAPVLRGAIAHDRTATLIAAAEQRGEAMYQSLVTQLQSALAAERLRGDEAFAARRAALERIGLPTVRRARLAELAAEEQHWRSTLDERANIHPKLCSLLFVGIT